MSKKKKYLSRFDEILHVFVTKKFTKSQRESESFTVKIEKIGHGPATEVSFPSKIIKKVNIELDQFLENRKKEPNFNKSFYETNVDGLTDVTSKFKSNKTFLFFLKLRLGIRIHGFGIQILDVDRGQRI